MTRNGLKRKLFEEQCVWGRFYCTKLMHVLPYNASPIIYIIKRKFMCYQERLVEDVVLVFQLRSSNVRAATIKSSFWDVRHIRLRKNQTLSVPKLKLLPHLLQQSPLQEAEISTNKGVVPH
ncbi:hypothetical protein CMV_003044 [Castanea mollissima]|uniref:Uncharacterized protein n=1 Tax=Castanea mollissima TaxID=60419 RepID=A0A8J4S0X3_9ROSI|nr:hypothetical protein CMV_003044 [Castanea mollissima]